MFLSKASVKPDEVRRFVVINSPKSFKALKATLREYDEGRKRFRAAENTPLLDRVQDLRFGNERVLRGERAQMRKADVESKVDVLSDQLAELSPII